ncbi:MAG: hypothetical protein PHI18_05355 [bacterium]|nr:hypothetical protein [bacterium]
MKRTLVICLLFAVGLWLTVGMTGCQSRPAAALKLFERGEYEQVIERYGDLEIALRAEAKIAERLLNEGKFEDVLQNHPNTPAAYQARQKQAKLLFDRGDYQAVVDSYPSSDVAVIAKERLADTLFAAGQLDLLLTKYPDTPRGTQVKEERAAEELKAAKKLKGNAKKEALNKLVRSYSGTTAQKEASQLLSDIRAAEVGQKRK